MSHVILAARLTWVGRERFFTDTPLEISAALLQDGQFEPRITGNIRWSEQARHPYQEQAGELVVGDLALVNADGELDSLAGGDVVGGTVELRRGFDADRWDDLEFVFVARVSSVRLAGRSELVLELENVLSRLSGPVFDDVFSGVANDELEGQAKPWVIGKIRQAPVKETDPANLVFYTADNATAITEVQEGGNPTTSYTTALPEFTMTASPTLQITADFENNQSLTYADAVPYILTTAGIDTTKHLDQAAINAHNTAAGSPEIGWLVADETVDQILFRLAGSLGGYVWQGLDGKVRSKRLNIPKDPGVDFLLLDTSRVDIDDVEAFDDPAPQLTRAAKGLRNWLPLPIDRQAGITSTWTESDRAAAAADWRLTRNYISTPQESQDFQRRWPSINSRPAYRSALRAGADLQTLANQALLWVRRPRLFTLDAEVQIGELPLVEVGQIVRSEMPFPGLRDKWLLVLGREGDARPGTVRLTLWGLPDDVFADRFIVIEGEGGVRLTTEAGIEIKTEDLI